MDDAELLRYSRQILLTDFGIEGQIRLQASRVLLVGLGGLGSPIAMYLAAAGVGRLVLSDFDHVDLSNLQRQIAHRQADIGRPKVVSAYDTLKALNPLVTVTPLNGRLVDEALDRQVSLADVVVDATDNFATRFALNASCIRHGKPLVSGAAIRMEGQISVFNLVPGQSPCYRCLYRDQGELGESCSETGVLAPLVGVIGSLQALETIKVLTGTGDALDGRLLIFDAKTLEWQEVALHRDPNCPVCSRTDVTRSETMGE
jgi:adenylyltransferase/sulfurtransferase